MKLAPMLKKNIMLTAAACVLGGVVLTIYKPDLQLKVAGFMGKQPMEG